VDATSPSEREVVRGWRNGVKLGIGPFWVGVGREEGVSSILSTLEVRWSKEVLEGPFPFGVGEVEVVGNSSKRRDEVCSGDGVEAEDMDVSVGDWAVGDSCTNSMFGGRVGVLFIIGESEVSIAVGSGGVVLSPSKALTWELLVACIGVIGMWLTELFILVFARFNHCGSWATENFQAGCG